MKSVIGGLIAIILGIFFFTLFFPAFLDFLAGIIPLSLIIGGGLALYLKHGETATDTWDKNNITKGPSPTAPPQTSPTATTPVPTEPVETEAIEAEAVETEPVETEPVETKPVKTEPVETEPVETEPVETKPVETQPVETKPVETKPVETKPVETQPVETQPVETQPGPQLFGNTDSLVFHTPDCRYSTNKHCTAVFNTRENAIQEGYKPCGVCKP